MNRIYKFLFASFLDDDEIIYYVAHRHIFVHVKIFAKVLFFGFFVPFIFQLFFPEAILFWVIWVVLGVGALIYEFFDWYYDVWLFTNFGVVNVEWNGFFDRSSTRVDYYMIEGISYSVKGVWHTVFNYGDILIERIGSASPVTLNDAYRPRAIERKFSHYHNQFMNEKKYSDHENLKGLLSEMLYEHVKENGIVSRKNQS